MGVAAALVVGAVVAAGATAYAAKSSSDASAEANAANAGNAAATNALNYKMFLEGRGSKGSALLPMYMKRGGKPFEKRLSRDVMQFYSQLQNRRSPDELRRKAQEARNVFLPAQQGAERTANQVFTGELTDESLGFLAPLADQRLESAETLRQVGREALSENVNRIDREAAAKGFVGDNFASRLLAGEMTRRSMSDAAVREAAAREQNALDTFKIRQAGMDRKLGSLNLPYAMAQQRVNWQNLPENEALDQAARRQQLFNFFKINPSAFQYQNMPTVQPVTPLGSIAGQGVSSAVGNVSNYYAQKALLDQMNQRGAQGNYDPNAPSWYNDYLNQPVNQALGPT